MKRSSGPAMALSSKDHEPYSTTTKNHRAKQQKRRLSDTPDIRYYFQQRPSNSSNTPTTPTTNERMAIMNREIYYATNHHHHSAATAATIYVPSAREQYPAAHAAAVTAEHQVERAAAYVSEDSSRSSPEIIEIDDNGDDSDDEAATPVPTILPPAAPLAPTCTANAGTGPKADPIVYNIDDDDDDSDEDAKLPAVMPSQFTEPLGGGCSSSQRHGGRSHMTALANPPVSDTDRKRPPMPPPSRNNGPMADVTPLFAAAWSTAPRFLDDDSDNDEDDELFAIPSHARMSSSTRLVANEPTTANQTSLLTAEATTRRESYPIFPRAAVAQPATVQPPQNPLPHNEDDQHEWPAHVDSPLYSCDEFEDIEDQMSAIMLSEKDAGKKSPLKVIESGICSHANHKVTEDFKQQSAQYGRIKHGAIEKLRGPKYLDIQPKDTFLDLGHGSGLVVLQIAYTVGCRSIGIELVKDRFAVSMAYLHMAKYELQAVQNRALAHRCGQLPPNGGQVEFRQGSFSDLQHLDFLTNPNGVTKCIVNNFGDVFGCRATTLSGKACPFYPDHFVAALFAKMQPGSVMVTLHPLDLGYSTDQAEEHRARHQLPPHPNASFFTMKSSVLGSQGDCVSWSTSSKTPLQVYTYTRLGQDKFLCCNPDCARNNELQEATEFRRMTEPISNRVVEVLVIRRCSCGYSIRPTRQRQSNVDYSNT